MQIQEKVYLVTFLLIMVKIIKINLMHLIMTKTKKGSYWCKS